MLLWREKAKDREAERQNLLLNQMTNCYATNGAIRENYKA